MGNDYRIKTKIYTKDVKVVKEKRLTSTRKIIGKA